MPGYTTSDKDFLSPAPAEPDYPVVKYLKPAPPASLRERVDRLLYGIKVDVPPEYDHYGYEIRRYMAHIAGPEVLGNSTRLEQELKNIGRAKIVHKYWRQELQKEAGEIQKIIDENPSASDARTMFKYNSGVVNAFLAESDVWLEKNEILLKFLLDRQDYYTYKDPNFKFDKNEDRLEFARHYEAARKSHEILSGYMMFRAMVY